VPSTPEPADEADVQGEPARPSPTDASDAVPPGASDAADAADDADAAVPSVANDVASVGGQRGRDWRLIGRMAALAILVAVADQLTKRWAESALAGHEPVPVLGEVIQFRLHYNPGAAFSIATGLTWLLTLVVVIVVVAIIRAAARIGSRAWTVALGMLLGGAVGNLIDRLFRAPGFPEGHVVDFIDYAGLFVGNVADIAIVVAAILVAVLSLRGIGLDGHRRLGQED
jgi:signal peptidase II